MSTMPKAGNSQYSKLIWMIVLSFIAMFNLMYSMVDKFANVIVNVNQFYMAGLMTVPMIIIELLLMGSMYMNEKIKPHNYFYQCCCIDCLFLFYQGTNRCFRQSIFKINDTTSCCCYPDG